MRRAVLLVTAMFVVGVSGGGPAPAGALAGPIGHWFTDTQSLAAPVVGHTLTAREASFNYDIVPIGGTTPGGPTGNVGWTLFDWPSLPAPRTAHTVSHLRDGRLLVVGGEPTGAEPETAYKMSHLGYAWSATGNMNVGRVGHTATTLRDGRVLVAGGGTDASTLTQVAEVYVQESDAWVVVGSLATARSGATATRMADGRVLLAGGVDSSGAALDSTEVFDPATNIWSAGPTMVTARSGHTATPLPDGRVLVAGGRTAAGPTPSAEIYDGGTWSSLPSLVDERAGHTATMLINGTVAIVGGADDSDSPLASVEIFDPATNTWSAGAAMSTPRSQHGAALGEDGHLHVAGGVGAGNVLLDSHEVYVPVLPPPLTYYYWQAVELADGRLYTATGPMAAIYDLAAGTSIPAAGMVTRDRPAFALLQDGRVLRAGGVLYAPVADVHIYDPATDTVAPGAPMPAPRHDATAVTLADGRVMVIGGGLEATHIYDPVTDSWTIGDPQTSLRRRPEAYVLADGRVLVAPGAFWNLPVSYPEVWDPVTETWADGASMPTLVGTVSSSMMADGRLMVSGTDAHPASAIYDPDSDTWTTLRAHSREPHPQWGGDLVRFADGRLLAVSLDAKLSDIYDPSAAVWHEAALKIPSARALSNGDVILEHRGQHLIPGGVLPRFSAIDTDGDGFFDAHEQALGEDPYTFCRVMRASFSIDDDFNDYGLISVIDLQIVATRFSDNPDAKVFDQNGSGSLNVVDLMLVASVINRSPTRSCN